MNDLSMYTICMHSFFWLVNLVPYLSSNLNALAKLKGEEEVKYIEPKHMIKIKITNNMRTALLGTTQPYDLNTYTLIK